MRHAFDVRMNQPCIDAWILVNELADQGFCVVSASIGYDQELCIWDLSRKLLYVVSHVLDLLACIANRNHYGQWRMICVLCNEVPSHSNRHSDILQQPLQVLLFSVVYATELLAIVVYVLLVQTKCLGKVLVSRLALSGEVVV